MENFGHISLDRIAAKQVFNGHILHGADRQSAHRKLCHAGDLLELTPRLAADTKDFFLILRCGCRDGIVDLIDLVLLNSAQDILAPADDGYILNVAVPLVLVVVDEADDFIAHFIA